MSVALALFQSLCAVGNCLETLRDVYEPMTDEWCALTDILGSLDEAIDTLVCSNGIDDGDNDAT